MTGRRASAPSPGVAGARCGGYVCQPPGGETPLPRCLAQAPLGSESGGRAWLSSLRCRRSRLRSERRRVQARTRPSRRGPSPRMAPPSAFFVRKYARIRGGSRRTVPSTAWTALTHPCGATRLHAGHGISAGGCRLGLGARCQSDPARSRHIAPRRTGCRCGRFSKVRDSVSRLVQAVFATNPYASEKRQGVAAGAGSMRCSAGTVSRSPGSAPDGTLNRFGVARSLP